MTWAASAKGGIKCWGTLTRGDSVCDFEWFVQDLFEQFLSAFVPKRSRPGQKLVHENTERPPIRFVRMATLQNVTEITDEAPD